MGATLETVKAVAATGGLGSGYSDESLASAMEAGADFIGCDAGSTDAGPYFLGSGKPKVSVEAYERDLRGMLRAAVEYGVPLLMGTSGYAGGRPHVEWAVQRVRAVAQKEGLSFDMARIDSELDPGYVRAAWRSGRIGSLPPSGPLAAEAIERSCRIVAQMGCEPFQEALRHGAQVIVAGRASDPAIFAAYPMNAGLSGGPTWHAAKVLECGAASVEHRIYPDCMMAEIGTEDFVIRPPNPRMRCTPQSVAAQTLYENADPYRLVEPSGVLNTTECVYTPDGKRGVRVRGSVMEPKDFYDVRLEGAALKGYRSASIGGVRDPVVLEDLDNFLEGAMASVRRKVEQSMGLRHGADYTVTVRVYGRDACLGPLEPTPRTDGHEIGLLLDVIGPDQESARGACAIAWHTVLHHYVPGWSGLLSNVAYPFSPPHLDGGPVYEFTMNHVLALDDPLEPFRISMESVG